MRSDRERRQQPSLTVTRHQDRHTSMSVSIAPGMSGSTAWLWRGIDVTDVHTEQPPDFWWTSASSTADTNRDARLISAVKIPGNLTARGRWRTSHPRSPAQFRRVYRRHFRGAGLAALLVLISDANGVLIRETPAPNVPVLNEISWRAPAIPPLGDRNAVTGTRAPVSLCS
jgi:hypothetical protein